FGLPMPASATSSPTIRSPFGSDLVQVDPPREARAGALRDDAYFEEGLDQCAVDIRDARIVRRCGFSAVVEHWGRTISVSPARPVRTVRVVDGWKPRTLGPLCRPVRSAHRTARIRAQSSADSPPRMPGYLPSRCGVGGRPPP